MNRSFVQFLSVCLIAMASLPSTWAQVIVGHRGASYDAPENTISAIRLAFEQGADGAEADFYLTSDNQIVCIHDKDTLRTGGKKLDVAKSTLAQLRELEYGAWFNEKFRGEQLPTFREVFKAIPDGKLFVIELKTGPEIVPFLKKELESLSIGQRKLLIIAFNQDTVVACKKQLPDIKVHWLTGFKEKDGNWTPTLDEVIATMQRIKPDGIGMQGNPQVVNAAFIQALRDASIHEFHVWTIDNVEEAKSFQTLGPFGITTNRPGLMRRELFSSNP